MLKDRIKNKLSYRFDGEQLNLLAEEVELIVKLEIKRFIKSVIPKKSNIGELFGKRRTAGFENKINNLYGRNDFRKLLIKNANDLFEKL